MLNPICFEGGGGGGGAGAGLGGIEVFSNLFCFYVIQQVKSNVRYSRDFVLSR